MTNQETIANLNMIKVAFVEPVTKEQRKLIDDTFDNAIKALSQEPMTGYWNGRGFCSECGCDAPAYVIDWRWQKDMDAKYCSNCGARMVKPQESEDKE